MWTQIFYASGIIILWRRYLSTRKLLFSHTILYATQNLTGISKILTEISLQLQDYREVGVFAGQ